MELRQLAYFVAVAHDESFTRAAQRLHVAQPGISQQIRRLETDLGQRLFDRSTTPIRLTAAGHAFLPHARDALNATETGRAALDQLDGVISGPLSLGTIPGIPHLDLAGLLATFHAAHPRVDVTLREEHPVPLIEHLRRDRYDAAIVGLSHPDRPDALTIQPISVEPLVLVTAAQHRLADRPDVAVHELRNETFVTLTRGSSLRAHLEDACEGAGFLPRIALETSDIDLLSDLVARGLGITILPRTLADLAAARHPLYVIDLHPPITQRHTVLAWKTGRPMPPAAEAFLTYATTWFADHAPAGIQPKRTPRREVQERVRTHIRTT